VLLLEAWERCAVPGIDVYHREPCTPEGAAAAARRLREARAFLADLLRPDRLPVRIECVLVPTPEQMATARGHACQGCADPGRPRIMEVYPGEAAPSGFGVHELAHCLSYQAWGTSEPLFEEGLAYYCEGRYAARRDRDDDQRRAVPRADGGGSPGRRRPGPDDYVRVLAQEGGLPPLAVLRRGAEFDRLVRVEALPVLAAATSFAAWVARAFGLPRFLGLYRTRDTKAALGLGLWDAEARWLADLNRGPTPAAVRREVEQQLRR